MTKKEKVELQELRQFVTEALNCLTASPPRRGAADYLLSARGLLDEMLVENHDRTN